MDTSLPGKFASISPIILPNATTVGKVIGNNHTADGPSYAPDGPTATTAKT